MENEFFGIKQLKLCLVTLVAVATYDTRGRKSKTRRLTSQSPHSTHSLIPKSSVRIKINNGSINEVAALLTLVVSALT